MKKSFTPGEIVRYSPAFCGPGEEKYIHVVRWAADDVQRCQIATLNSKLTIGYPTEVVTYDMIVSTGFTVSPDSRNPLSDYEAQTERK